MAIFSTFKTKTSHVPLIEVMELDDELHLHNDLDLVNDLRSDLDVDRKRPVIEVVGARPMSEVGFRDAKPNEGATSNRPTLPPPPKRPGE